MPLLLAVNAMKKAAIVLVLLQFLVLSAHAAEPKECSFCAGAVAALPASPIPLLEEVTLDDAAAIDAMTPAQRAKTVVLIRYALDNLPPEMPDAIPAMVCAHLNLISPREALVKVHWPDEGESRDDLQASRTPAHIRLIFEELFFTELGLELKRRQQKAQSGIAFGASSRAPRYETNSMPRKSGIAPKKGASPRPKTR